MYIIYKHKKKKKFKISEKEYLLEKLNIVHQRDQVYLFQFYTTFFKSKKTFLNFVLILL